MSAGAGTSSFKAELGFWSLTFLIVGSMIGSGIFFKPGSMLHATGSVPLVMLAWVGGAVIALSGGLMFAELGAAFPKAGGQYVFLRDGLGKLPGFLFSWTGFTVVQTGTFAAVAVALAQAFDVFLEKAFGVSLPGSEPCLGSVSASGACTGFQLPPWGVGFLAVGIVVLLSVINFYGVKRAAFLNNMSTIAKLGALGIIMLLALFASDAGNFTGNGSLPTEGGPGRGTFAGFAVALAASLFAYDGFAQATFVAGEVKDARRVVPRAIITAGVGVAAIYLLTTFAYFHVLPANEISVAALTNKAPIAAEAMGHVFSGGGVFFAGAVAVAIVVSTFGTVNSYVLASPRIYHSVAQDGEFPRAFGVLSRFRTPTYGLWFGAIWGGLLVLSGGFETLSELVVFGLYVFYLLTVVTYFVLLRRQPEAFQSFKVPGRPVPAIVFGLGSLYVLYSYLQADIPALARMTSPLDILTNTTLFGLLLIGSGLVAYLFVRRNRPNAS